MLTPADESNYYNSIVTNQIAEINNKSLNSSSIIPQFSDYFQTPEGLPSNTNYFNEYTNNTFGLNSILNPFNNYIETVKTSITNCEFPPLPTSAIFPTGDSLLNLLNINIFDRALKILSIQPKASSFPLTSIGSTLLNTVLSVAKSVAGPFAKYLNNVSNCISKLAS
jgi:hypothetical protein